MFGTHDLWVFVAAGLLLNITPGPDTLYIAGRGTTQGLRAGTVAALGIGAGTLVHIAAAALGLSAILAASATAFTAVKIAGALYLVYVGIGLIRPSGAGSVRPAAYESAPLRKVFVQGFLTNVLNPKVALFFLAFLPQFVSAESSSKALALLFLGVIFDLNGTLWNLFVAWSSARLTGGLRRSAPFTKWFDRAVGSIFVLLGIRLAFVRN